MRQRVKAHMTGDPISTHPSASALEAFELIQRHGIRHLPVVDSTRRVVGVLSINDLQAALPIGATSTQALSPREREIAIEWRVGELMTYAPETLGAEDSLADAADRMAERRIGCLPIVDAEGRLLGILSETDLFRALASTAWSATLGEERTEEAATIELTAALREERARIAERVEGYRSAERELAAIQHDEPMDDPERAADLREAGFLERLDELAANRLGAIDRALERAEQGTLTECSDCGGTIPVARLRAMPESTRCVACARRTEKARESEPPFERVPGGRAETGRPELGEHVYTQFGEGQLLRVTSFGTCARCGDLEGRHDPDSDAVRCAHPRCRRLLTDVRDRAVVAIGEREVYVDPLEITSVAAAPYD
jgi:acetoin utilization protein AcuB